MFDNQQNINQNINPNYRFPVMFPNQMEQQAIQINRAQQPQLTYMYPNTQNYNVYGIPQAPIQIVPMIQMAQTIPSNIIQDLGQTEMIQQEHYETTQNKLREEFEKQQKELKNKHCCDCCCNNCGWIDACVIL